LPRIESEETSFVAVFDSLFENINRQLVVWRPVELKEPCSVSIHFCNVTNRLRSGSREAVRQIEISSDGGRIELAKGMIDSVDHGSVRRPRIGTTAYERSLVDSDGTETDGSVKSPFRVSKFELARHVSFIRVDEHAGEVPESK